MRTRSRDLADELRQVISLAGRDLEALEGEVSVRPALHRDQAADHLDEPARMHLTRHRMVPDELAQHSHGASG